MRISHRQFVWQQQPLNWRWIIRYYKLFNTPSIVAICEQGTGLTIDKIYLIGVAFLGIFSRHPLIAQQMNIEIPGLDQAQIDLFLRLTSLGRAELSNRLRVEHSLDENFFYRYSSLREFPLIRISHRGRNEIACPIPTLLFWRITTGLYYDLKDERGFPTAFGQSFQWYVGEVLHKRMTNEAMVVLEEAEYQVGKHRKDAVDWIIQQGDQAALFVECKTKRLRWASKAGLTDLTALQQDIRKLAGAVVQVYRTIGDYHAGRYPNLAFVEGRHVYPTVVTLEDWYLFGRELPDRLETAVRTATVAGGLPVGWLDEMPYSIMSVDEFEKAIGVINTVGVHPFISGKVLDPERRRWAYGAYCSDRYKGEVTNLPGLFHDEYNAMFAGLCE
jgi:hypothetical protein